MGLKIEAIRGMNDVLPDKMCYWAETEAICRDVVSCYGYREIRFPIVEATNLFKRSIGEATDIVEKEMYTFDDRNGDSLTLRPEGTAGCVRAGIQHGLLYHQIQKLWYIGPMFRHERPQKGRYRQFYQFGVEAYGMAGPEIDAEIILISARFLKALGLIDKVALQLNTLGSQASRGAYRIKLVEFLEKHVDQLDEDSQRRLKTNPLRILDSKNQKTQEIVAHAPKMLDCLDDDSKRHFERLCELLEFAGIDYTINPALVRGLDYYCHTVFEWVTDALGAQGTVCAGGRYDSLVELLGDKPTPAVGFACGLERLVLLYETVKSCDQNPDIYWVVSDEVVSQGLVMAEKLRTALPTFKIEMDTAGGNFKKQFKRADKSGAKYGLILGADEVAQQKITVKFLRDQKPQLQLSEAELISFLKNGEE